MGVKKNWLNAVRLLSVHLLPVNQQENKTEGKISTTPPKSVRWINFLWDILHLHETVTARRAEGTVPGVVLLVNAITPHQPQTGLESFRRARQTFGLFFHVLQVVPEWLWRAHLPEVSSVKKNVSVTQLLSAALWHRWLYCGWEGLEFAFQKTLFALYCLPLFCTVYRYISIHDGQHATVRWSSEHV